MAKLSQKLIQRALAKAKAQPKDKVSLKKAPWDKEETKEGNNKEEIIMNPKKVKDKKSDVEGQEVQERTVNSADKKPENYTDPQGKMRTRMVPVKKEVKESVYSRILEKRDMHTQGATPPEEMDSKDSGTAKKMRADMKGEVVSPEVQSVSDMDKAMNAGPSKKPRPNDKSDGDKNIINPVKKD